MKQRMGNIGMAGNRTNKPRFPAPDVIWRSLGAREVGIAGVSRVLDVVSLASADIAAPRVIAFFGNGTSPDIFAPDGRDGSALPLDLRDVSGGTLAMLDPRGEGPLKLALTSGDDLTLTPVPDETAFLSGLNTILAFRWEETIAQTAEMLLFHARSHGMQGAVIINRLPLDAAWVQALTNELAVSEAGSALRVVLLDSPLPLGKPDLGPENHPYLAPDAPGKDRMEVPENDTWRSPLNEALIFEIAKWRFLASARAVLALDISDFLLPVPDGAPNAFDRCCNAQNGVILLSGSRVYPWRVRPKREARFGDHICVPFDKGNPTQRWGVAPQKAGLVNTWRATRISYANPDAQAALPFCRAMAIRVPGRNTSELAPKTSLVENDTLLALAEQVFDHSPVRAPVSKLKAAPKAAIKAGRTAIVTTMKNEGPFILEWLAYHRAIGVDDFLIYTNDCTDGTDTMLDMLQDKGIVQHRANPYVPGGDLKPQHAALQAAETEPVMQDCGWGICMDVDEFINIKIGDGTLNALYKAMGDANMISLTWRLFGNSDVHEYKDEFLLSQFTDCAPEVIRKPHQAWGFKTLYRNVDIYKKLGVHRPKGLVPDLWDQVKWLNGSGRPLPRTMFRNGWRSTLDTYGYDWVQLNHYATRSAESFLVKRDRGRVNHVDRDQGLNYWFRMNHNLDNDRSIQRTIPALRAEYDRLLADPDIRTAHAYSVRCHREKIAELMATENYRKFYTELSGPRMERLCRMQQHFGSAVFAAGPAAIPDDLHLRDLPPDFFFTVDHSGEAEH
ncbi:glycosyltransferase family 2 protein [Pseudorhodobacter sp.]|uniref:glycosyltransferase family 2 protein n=1 Tax=Pseudorhodobacter sp. TaxID=1934400 RepID=UPI002648D13F|nr:glycosyltransferase family 2 protein [Pseudorhodobacter sp.]MDN5786424.1 glycosyltransferase family 2 protein [Pseudorhodobacter sp.]